MSAGDAPAATAVERLSVATAIIGLLAVGGKIMEKIWDLNLPSTKHTPALTQALHQVKQCRSTVHILYKTFCRLEAARLPFPERAAWIAVDDLIATLADTVLAFSDLQIICDALERQRLEPSGAAASAPGYDDRLGALCSRMRWQSLSMTIMMTILKCPGAADAEYARVGLERRMTRILTSNTALAQRMRLLEGAVDSRAIDRSALPHYPPPAPSAPPPGPAAAPADGPARGRAASPFSGFTLADVPVMSIVPLPVTTDELRDGNELYTAAYARLVGRDLGELLHSADDQSASRTLGVILGRTGTQNHTGSMTGTDSSNDACPQAEEEEEEAPATKQQRFRRIRVKRRWRT